MEELELEPGEQIIESIVAARLNGYINGYGDKVSYIYIQVCSFRWFTLKENLLSEKEELGLTSKVVNYVIRKMEEKREKAWENHGEEDDEHEDKSEETFCFDVKHFPEIISHN